jgi:sulfur carrier protein ThiS
MQLASNRETIEVTGDNVKQCLDDLIRKLPGAARYLFNSEGSPAVLFLLNNEPLPGQALSHQVADNDELWLLSIVTGG